MQRILRGTPATLTFDLTDSDGSPVEADGIVTVRVVDAAGTVVLAAGTATVEDDDLVGRYSVTVPATATAAVTMLTATWIDGNHPTIAWVTSHEVVGGFLFTVAQARAFPDLDNEPDYPTPAILEARTDVEDEAEWICGTPLFTRYRRVVLDGPGADRITVGLWDISAVRSVRTYPFAGASTFTALTAGQLAGLVVGGDLTLRRTDGAVFDDGGGTIAVELELGRTDWGADLRRAALTRCRDLLNHPNSRVPSRAKAYTSQDGFSYDLTVQDEYKTGIPEVDAVYARYSRRAIPGSDGEGGSGQVAISRTLSYDPQRNSLFHGGPR